ncbi:MAG: Uma2 family endonuclease [Armatimonadaceae bacterium]
MKSSSAVEVTNILAEQRIVLNNIRWKTYECLLNDHTDQAVPRFVFDRGTLEIMSPLSRHEEVNRSLNKIVETVLDTWDWVYRNLGSTTFRREDLERGFEPDTCFYIQSAAQIAETEQVDVREGDPVPDLVIEIDLSSSSLPKEPIFAAFSIPEVWRYSEDRLTIWILDSENYREQEESVALPGVTTALLNRWLSTFRRTRPAAWVREIRQWAETHLP